MKNTAIASGFLLIAFCASAFAKVPLQVQAPEPGTIVLMGAALVAGGAFTAWKRRNRK
jgi:PEP-CTERM motif